MNSKKLRVWHMPQVPCKSFYVEVDTIKEAVLLLNSLANYDLFQFENNIKPDFSNMNGLEHFDEKSKEWEDWFIDDTTYGYFDDPLEYIATINENIKEK